MKFWELISAFRSEKEILASTLEHPEWKEFKEYFQQFTQLVNNRDRKILDKQIPPQLAIDVCSKSNMKFYYYFEHTPPMICKQNQLKNENFQLITPLEIHEKFGGQHIEETLEKGSSIIND